MTMDPVRAARTREYDKDHGACHYCGGYTYVIVANWINHMLTEHPDTVRTRVIQHAIAEAEAELPENDRRRHADQVCPHGLHFNGFYCPECAEAT